MLLLIYTNVEQCCKSQKEEYLGKRRMKGKMPTGGQIAFVFCQFLELPRPMAGS